MFRIPDPSLPYSKLSSVKRKFYLEPVLSNIPLVYLLQHKNIIQKIDSI